MSKLRDDKVSVEVDLRAQKAQEEIHKLTKEIENIRKQNAEHRKEISRLAATEGDYSAEIKRLNETIRANTKEIDRRKKAIGSEREKIDLSRMSAADLKKELRNLTRQLSNTSKALHPEEWKKTEAEIKRCKEALQQAEAPTKSLWEKFKSLPSVAQVMQGALLSVGTVITTYVLGSFKQLVATIQDFERSNSKLAAVLGTSIDGVSRLTEQAKFLGRTTTATASQVTGLQTELAKLGFSQDVIEKLTPATLKFAKSVDTDLSSAAAFAGAAMRMFNKDAGDAESVMATFAVATTKSALDFEKLQASLSTVGPVANSFGFTVEETTALLGQLSNAGFDASTAATATRNILLNLADANGDLAQALGGPVTNLDGLVAGLKKLESEGVNLAKALELTDKRSVAAFEVFLKGADNISGLRDSITNCTADFNQMSKTMGNNAAGSWAGFESAVEGLLLKFFDLREALKLFYEWATVVVNWIGSIVDSLAPLGQMIAFAAGVCAQLVSVIGTLVGWLTNLFTQTAVGRVIINGLVAGLVAYKIATLAASKATLQFRTSIVTAVKNIGTFIKSIALKTTAIIKDAIATRSATVALRAFTAALLSNPITLVVTGLAMAVAAFMGYSDAAEDATEKTDAWTEASRTAAKQYGEQKGKIESLLMVAENENISLDRRKKAVAELNRIIPGYNAKIDETTLKYIASKEALDKYLQSLEKEMRYKANEQKMSELLATAEEARDAYDEAIINYNNASNKKRFIWQSSDKDKARETLKEAKQTWDDAESSYKAFKERMEKAMEEGEIIAPSKEESPVTTGLTDPLKNANSVASETVTRLKEINAELKRLRKINPDSDEELDRIQKRIKLLQDEKKALMGKAKKGKRERGTYEEDSLDAVTAPIDDRHQREVLKINKEDWTETEKTIAKNKELIRYCAELTTALEELRGKTKSTHTKTLDAINAEQNKLARQSVDAQKEINKALAQQEADGHQKRLSAIEVFYQRQNDLQTAAVAAGHISQEAAEIYMAANERQSHEDRLKELQDYYNKVAAADYMGAEEKQKLLQKISADINQAQSTILTDSAKFAEKLREMSTDTTSAAGIEAQYKRQRVALQETYDAMIEAVGEGTEEAVTLEAEKNRRIAALDYEHKEQIFQLQELTGLSWDQEFDRELLKLENMHEQGLISEENYQKARLMLQVNNAKKYFDYYAQLSGSMFTAIQDAEIATSEAKYDVLIQQAKNNGEDTAALEEEKENKKLEIQKKYADVNFAIKVSQIIADTAVSIMKAFADLGPIAGAVAAAMLTATGAAQVVSAKAERDKIKNMQPSHTAGSGDTTPKTAERVLSGYSDGGYTGDGDRYEVAGLVHRGEYVVPKPIMDNPRVVDAVGTIEAIRRNKILGSGIPVGTPSIGFAVGGYTSDAPQTSSTELVEVVKDLRTAIAGVRNIKAYVKYQDIERAGNDLKRARDPFTRKK